MRVLYCDYGTYCDFAISKQMITNFLKNNIKVFYITSDENQQISQLSSPHLEVVRYASPPVKDVIPFADNRNVIYALLDVRKVFTTIGVLVRQSKTFNFIVDTVKSQWQSMDMLLFTYPLMCIVRRLITSSSLPPRLPMVVLYVAPAFPNIYIPWIFDERIIDLQTDIVSSKDKDMKVRSHVWNDVAVSLCGEKREFINLFWGYKDNKKYLMKRFPNLYVISAWNKGLIPPEVAPINVPPSHWFSINGIFERSQPKPLLPSIVREFLKKPGKLLYLTLGSMETTELHSFVKVLQKAIKGKDMKLLVHDSQKQLRRRSTDHLLIVSGFLPYTSILPKTTLLITTGSYCIQHLALYYHVPMLFVPVLTEQYFWAKNYQQQTGIPYVDDMTYSKHNVQSVSETISLILSSTTLKKWLDQQSKNIKKTDGAKEATKVLQKIIQIRS